MPVSGERDSDVGRWKAAAAAPGGLRPLVVGSCRARGRKADEGSDAEDFSFPDMSASCIAPEDSSWKESECPRLFCRRGSEA